MSIASSGTAADLTLRPATLDEAAFVADLRTAARPDDPADPVLERYWWENPWDDSVWERYIVLRDGRPVGYSAVNHVQWEKMPERYARLQGEILPELRTAERIGALLAFAEHRAKEDGALRVTTWAWEDDAVKLAAIAARGLREDRRERFWELDLLAHRASLTAMADRSRGRMREQGIRVGVLAEDRDGDRYRKLWRMNNEAQRDVPTTVPHVDQPFDAFERWLRNPAVREDRTWIARDGDDIVGISMLAYPPVRGVVYTEWTGTARSVRGKGVARALKCETAMEAIDLGVDRIQTDNDSRNAPILHINESMGYRIRGEMIQLVKQL